MFAYFNLLSNWNDFLRCCDNEYEPIYNKYWITIHNKFDKDYYSWDMEKGNFTRKEMWDKLQNLLNNNKDLNEKFINFILSVPVDVIDPTK